MNLYFAQKFKQLRRNIDMTQEEISSVFGVSPQAISRWETGATYPDIEMLPIISEFFAVSLEELLGVEQLHRKEKAQEYKLRFKSLIERGNIEEGVKVSREAVKAFPRDWELQNQLMYALFVSGSDDGNIANWKENQEKYKQEIIDIGNYIIKYCTDDRIRLEAKSRLGFHYCEIGNFEEGKRIFESLPAIDSCKESMMYWALSGEERRRYNRDCFSAFLSRTLWNLWTVIADDVGEYDDIVREYKKYETIIDIVYDYGDYGDWNLGLAQLYFYKLTPLALKYDRLDDMFSFLEKGLFYMKNFSKMPEQYEHTSYLVRGVVDSRYGDPADSREPWEIIIDCYLSDKMYDFVRGDLRFVNIVEELKHINYAN